MMNKVQDALKWEVEKLVGKLDLYNTENLVACGPESIAPMCGFFQTNKTEIFMVDAKGNQYEMLESMRIYIERFGRPYNYLKTVQHLNQEREKTLIEEE
jgi:hypothetical protein